jgi:hypothetical protein
MSQNWIFINSPSYRRFIEVSKEKRWMLYAAAAAASGVSLFAGYVVVNATNPNFEEEGYKDKKTELAKLPMHSQVRSGMHHDTRRLCPPTPLSPLS